MPEPHADRVNTWIVDDDLCQAFDRHLVQLVHIWVVGSTFVDTSVLTHELRDTAWSRLRCVVRSGVGIVKSHDAGIFGNVLRNGRRRRSKGSSPRLVETVRQYLGKDPTRPARDAIFECHFIGARAH